MLNIIIQTRTPSFYSFLETTLTALIPLAIIILGTAVYYNRQKTNKLYQRLFGLNADKIDKGYILKMSKDMDSIEEKIDELNQSKIRTIEAQIEELQNDLQAVEENMKTLKDRVEHNEDERD